MNKRIHPPWRARIDSMWMWRLDEGMFETLSTVRCACDFIEQYPGFTFTHNESILYEFVERADPELFARIRRHVRGGRFCLAGLPGAKGRFFVIRRGLRWTREQARAK